GPQYYCDGCLTLGYQYPRIDYLFSQTTVNGNLTFQPGTVVAWQGQGLSFSGAYTLTFDGTVQNRCYFLPCNTVQEQSSGGGPGIAGNGVSATMNATFTRFWAVDSATFFDANSLNVQDAYNCEFWQGTLGGAGFVIGGLDLYLVNCLLDDSSVNFNTTSTSGSCYLSMQNCTMIAGALYINRNNSAWTVSVSDSAFDETTITVEGSYGDASINASYNAYSGGYFLPNDPRPPSIYVADGFMWQLGPLGNFYLPDDTQYQDGTLCIDHGDRDASAIQVTVDASTGAYNDLDAFTTQTSQEPDCGIVDIGYHYPANPPLLLGPDAYWHVTDVTDPNNTVDLGSLQAPFGQGYCPVGCGGYTISPPINTKWPLNTTWRLDSTIYIPNNVDLSQVKFFFAIDNFYGLTVNGHSIFGYGNQNAPATWLGPYLIGAGNLSYGNNSVEATITDIGVVDYFSMIITTGDCYPVYGPLY
ncbi:MAG: hypothetical protein KGJ60_06450, partial [Verrucomicrobiota bacterium]|nr:hypothetical protein [Verrucomicrobiota bacterium]